MAVRGWFLPFLAAAALVGCGHGAKVSEQRASSQHETVEVHGQKLKVHCSGSGSPTVVFEAALTFNSTEWAEVEPQVAKMTRACAYDRLGEGLSEHVRPGVVQTVAVQAETLRAVLDEARIDPPYVLVGHSWGGAVVQRFAFDQHDTLAGIVLVESSQADIVQHWLAMLPPAPKSGVDRFAEVRRALADTLNPSDNPEHVDERASFPQLRELKSLGSVPLVVLTAGTSALAAGLPSRYAQRSYEIWLRVQSQLAALSSDSVHAVDGPADHLIPTEDPAAVVAAVTQVVKAARKDRHLSPCRVVFSGIPGIRCL
jgi:pimeloyl-ACP methyl ester carboxylesterase